MLVQIYKENQPSSLSNIVPQRHFAFNTRNIDKTPLFKIKHNFFKNSFFFRVVLNGTSSMLIFGVKTVFTFLKRNILQFITPTLSSFLNCHDPKRIKLVTRLCTVLNHLREHKFKHSFQDSLNPI